MFYRSAALIVITAVLNVYEPDAARTAILCILDLLLVKVGSDYGDLMHQLKKLKIRQLVLHLCNASSITTNLVNCESKNIQREQIHSKLRNNIKRICAEFK